MHRNAHCELMMINMYSVKKVDDTGKCRLSELIAAIETRTDLDIRSLVPIFRSYQAIDLDATCSAAQLRDAIGVRLEKDLPFEELQAQLCDDSASDFED